MIRNKVNKNNIPSREKIIDLNGKYIFPGLVDMRVFAGEPGYEYKENFRTLSNAALAGGVTSVVTMPNTDPIIDNVSIVDFLKRIELAFIFIADFLFDNCEICIQPELFSKSLTFLHVSDLPKTKIGRYFFL